MILEVATLDIIAGQEQAFENNFRLAQGIITRMEGYIDHQLQHCIEQPNRYMLLVRWQTLEHHMTGFRQSAQYQEWKQLLHAFYEPFPTVQHYQQVALP